MLDDNKPSLEDAITHFGVKGMRWGVSSAAKNLVNGKPDSAGVNRKDVRVAKRTARRKVSDQLDDFDFQPGRLRDADINKARENVRKANRDFRDMKTELKSRKAEVGKNAVKVTLARRGVSNTVLNAKAQADTRTEAAVKAAIEVGQMIAKEFSRSASRSRAAQAQAMGNRPDPQVPRRV